MPPADATPSAAAATVHGQSGAAGTAPAHSHDTAKMTAACATPCTTRKSPRPSTSAQASVPAYYAGAVAALFILLAGVPIAAALHDELASGVADRSGRGPPRPWRLAWRRPAARCSLLGSAARRVRP